MKNEFVYEGLRKNFKNLGKRVGTNPTNFIIFPILLTLLLLTGFQKLKLLSDIKTILISPTNKEELHRRYVEKMFPINTSSNFEPGRRTSEGRFGVAIITAMDGGSVLRHSVFKEIKLLDEKVKQIVINWDKLQWKYEDICARNERQCFDNTILNLEEHMKEIESGNITLKYPIHELGGVNESLLALGGVIRTKQNDIIYAKSVLLNYFLDTSRESKDVRSSLWEEAFVNLMENMTSANIITESSISTSFNKELEKGPFMAVSYIHVSVILLLTFTIVTSSSPDWLRSKPWTGILTAAASGMAIVSGFGLILYFGVPFISANILIPFLVLGIGMDDTFVMLSAWKQTDHKKTVDEKLSETYREAGVSITITSVTNFISFIVGWIFASNVGSTSFCIYMSSCIAFDFIYQVTFVGACFVWCGYAEEKGLHSLFFVPLKKDSEPGGNKISSKLLCTTYPTDQNTKPRNKFSFAMFDEFWKAMAEILTWKISKFLVMCLYLAYLAVACWGCTKLVTTDTYRSLVISNSSMDRFLDSSYSNYYEHRDRIQFIIDKTLNYADPHVQANIENMMKTFEADEFLSGPELTESWLRIYLKFITAPAMSVFLSDYNMTEPSTFIEILRRLFLSHPKTRRFQSDIVFNKNYTQIIASRFLCQTNITRSNKDFRTQAKGFRKVVANASYPVIMFHSNFPLFDGLDYLIPTTVYTLCTVAITVIIVSWIFLPDMIGTLCIIYSIFSINISIFGYMRLWGITISIGTLTILIVATGLSVDYAAHLCCAYTSKKDRSPNEKLREAVILAGMPVFQGAISTVLTVIIFCLLPSSSFVAIIKLLALVCLTGALHGIVILPVIIFLIESLILFVKSFRSSKTVVISKH